MTVSLPREAAGSIPIDWSVRDRGGMGRVDLSDTPEQAAYRERVRAWVEAHAGEAPPASGSSEDGAYIDARRRWQGRLAEAGLAGVTWPKEYGGQGLGPIEHVIVGQE